MVWLPFPNVQTQFGQPAAERAAEMGRRTVVGKKRIRELQRAVIISQALSEVVGEDDQPFQGDALALFQRVYANTSLPLELRLSAAKHAAAFERPTLAAVATRDMGPATKTLEALLEEKARIAEDRSLALTTRPNALADRDERT